ncbi:AAA family ATPase [Tessaracoccus lubricantis]|uniref:AAA family ATPase n=1 Tax=Tessaracoccus lubricantis TaxID=545543 RepID=A0ABP9FD50_9ACTN
MLRRPEEPRRLAEVREKRAGARKAEGGTPPGAAPELHAVLRDPEVLATLLAMTRGNCAYCERPLEALGTDAAAVTHHRPPWGAMGLDGKADLAAYGWLTYSWENLFAACADCIRTRGTRFPVAGPRATSPDTLADEEALLLDPLLDDPAAHLRHDPDGAVRPLTERGRVTIELFALNREALVRARATHVERGWDGDDDSFPTLRRQVSPGADRFAMAAPPAAGPELPPSPSQGYDLSAAVGAEQEQYFRTAQWIERVVIRNFRPIREVDIDFSRSTSGRGPWTVLLGENGSGKSSVLHALALTLMGGDQRRALRIDARNYLRHGARNGLVQVFLSGRTEPLELVWRKGDAEFTGPEPVPALLLGYGATRLLPREAPSGPDDRVVRVDNLFDPLLPLTDPTAWLLTLDDTTFDDVARGIHAMLALDATSGLERRRGRVVLRQGRSISDLASLSDGYQSMVVMACDILRSVLRLWSHSSLAEGIVLLDEIGAHLHPRWRLRIVGALRDLLPRVQFVVTTHDPLCLRGIVDGEVVVVRRNNDGDVVTLSDLPPVTGMSIEQLLTSEHFGLGSTDDPEVAELWELYYRLKAVPKPTPEEAKELERVRSRLDVLEQLGTTERERLLLASADEYIAARRQRGDAEAPTTAEVTARLTALWDEHLPRSWR